MADEAIRFGFEGDVDQIVRELDKVTKEGKKQGQALAREIGKSNTAITKDAARSGSKVQATWKTAFTGVGAAVAGASVAFAGLGAAVVGVAATFKDWSDDISGVVDTVGTMSTATGLRLMAGATNTSRATSALRMTWWAPRCSTPSSCRT